MDFWDGMERELAKLRDREKKALARVTAEQQKLTPIQEDIKTIQGLLKVAKGQAIVTEMNGNIPQSVTQRHQKIMNVLRGKVMPTQAIADAINDGYHNTYAALNKLAETGRIAGQKDAQDHWYWSVPGTIPAVKDEGEGDS